MHSGYTFARMYASFLLFFQWHPSPVVSHNLSATGLSLTTVEGLQYNMYKPTLLSTDNIYCDQHDIHVGATEIQGKYTLLYNSCKVLDWIVYLLEWCLDGDDPGVINGSAIRTVVKPPA